MQKFKYYLKRFGIDAAGYGLIVLGILLGWLPGPGGIPLILGGLGLLSIHNHWARKLLQYAKENGLKFMKYIFPENPWIKAAHDLLALTLVVSVVFILQSKITYTTIAISIGLGALATVDFFYNRHRWKRLKKRIKKS